MATRVITVHDRCTEPGCGKVLHTIIEGESGLCGGCRFKKMPADTKAAMNRLISMAFKPATEKEKDSAVQEALDKLKRDRGE